MITLTPHCNLCSIPVSSPLPMADFPTLFSFFAFFLLLSSLQIQARESHFFNKVSRSDTLQETKPINTPASDPKKEEPAEYPQSQNGYGLYGSNSNSKQLSEKDGFEKYPPTTANLNNAYSNQYSNEQSYKNKDFATSYPDNEYSTKKYTEEYSNDQTYKSTSYPSTEYQNKQYEEEYSNGQRFKNKESASSYPPNEYQNKQFGGGYKDDLSYGNKESTTSYAANDYRNKQYGMSDTRFLENGKYYVEVVGENNGQNEYVWKGSNQGYAPSRYANSQNKYSNNGYYGNNENSYESNNSVNGYRNSQEENEENEFLP